MLVDSHVHVVSRDHAAHPLRPNHPGLTWVTEHACPADEYTALMDANGIGQAVLVQAMGAYTDDNSYCLESANADRRRFASVVYVDAHGDDSASTLDGWVARDAAPTPANAGVGAASSRGVTGVRIVAITGPITEPAVEALWAHAATCGIPIVATVLAPELVRLPSLLERYPGVPVALDHCGFPDLSGGPAYPSARPLFELAAFPNLHAKVSTNALDLAVAGGGDPRDFVVAMAEAYGASRLQWGSDWSQTHDRPFADLVAYARRSFSVLGDDARWPLGDTARAFWFAPAA